MAREHSFSSLSLCYPPFPSPILLQYSLQRRTREFKRRGGGGILGDFGFGRGKFSKKHPSNMKYSHFPGLGRGWGGGGGGKLSPESPWKRTYSLQYDSLKTMWISSQPKDHIQILSDGNHASVNSEKIWALSQDSRWCACDDNFIERIYCSFES